MQSQITGTLGVGYVHVPLSMLLRTLILIRTLTPPPFDMFPHSTSRGIASTRATAKRPRAPRGREGGPSFFRRHDPKKVVRQVVVLVKTSSTRNKDLSSRLGPKPGPTGFKVSCR